MPELRCPHCNRKLAQIEDNYLGFLDERYDEESQARIVIKCPKCKDMARFGGLLDALYA